MLEKQTRVVVSMVYDLKLAIASFLRKSCVPWAASMLSLVFVCVCVCVCVYVCVCVCMFDISLASSFSGSCQCFGVGTLPSSSQFLPLLFVPAQKLI